jgi:hypothetical protein
MDDDGALPAPVDLADVLAPSHAARPPPDRRGPPHLSSDGAEVLLMEPSATVDTPSDLTAQRRVV